MRKFDSTDNITLIVFLIFSLMGYIFMDLSNYLDKDDDSKINYTKFYIAIVSYSIACIACIVFVVRTGIDLTRPTITQTNIQGVQQINPGMKLF